MSVDTDSNPRKVVPITFRYMKFSPEPHEVEEKRHLYFTMGAVQKLMDKYGVDKQAAREAAQDAESPEEAQERMNEILEETELGMSEEEAIIVFVWAGLLPEAQSRGENLTVDQVGHMVDLENIDEVTEAINEAWQYFQQGQEAEGDGPNPADKMAQKAAEEDTAGKEQRGETYETTGDEQSVPTGRENFPT